MKTIAIWLMLFAFSTPCPMSVACPVDGQPMYKSGDDYAGIKHLATYEHTTTDGMVHKLTIECKEQ